MFRDTFISDSYMAVIYSIRHGQVRYEAATRACHQYRVSEKVACIQIHSHLPVKAYAECPPPMYNCIATRLCVWKVYSYLRSYLNAVPLLYGF